MFLPPSWPLLAAWRDRQIPMAQLMVGGARARGDAGAGAVRGERGVVGAGAGAEAGAGDVFPLGTWVCPARVPPSRAIVERIRRGEVAGATLVAAPPTPRGARPGAPAGPGGGERPPKRARADEGGVVEVEEARARARVEEATGGFDAAVAAVEAEDADEEDVCAALAWLPAFAGTLPDRAGLWRWVREGKARIGVEGEDRWCDWRSLDCMVRAQMSVEGLEGERREDARARSNAWEALAWEGTNMFMNRGALKVAEADARSGWALTRPTAADAGASAGARGPDAVLFFGEVGGGPGGWAEYVFWRKRSFARGLGMTLAGPSDYRRRAFHREAPYETLERAYGADGTGDVCSGVNVRLLFSRVAEVTESKGVHLFLADAGWAGDGRGVGEQEVDHKQVVVAEVLAALGSLRRGGHLVLKVYDLLTDFSVGMLFLLRALFDRVGVFKPRASRPTAAEREVVCLGLRERAPRDVIDHLFRLNDRMAALKDADAGRTVLEVVPPEVMEADVPFKDAIVAMNDAFAARACRAARRLLAFHEDDRLVDAGQADRAARALRAWRVPVGGREPREVRTPDAEAARCILRGAEMLRCELSEVAAVGRDAARRRLEDREILRSGPGVALPLDNEAVMASAKGQKPRYRFVHNVAVAVSTDQPRGFLVGCGAPAGYACEARTSDGVEEDRWRGAWFCEDTQWKTDEAAAQGGGAGGRPWRPVPGLVLPRGTLLEAEIANEYHPVVGSQGVWRRQKAFHVLDAVTVSGVDVREWPFELRMRMVRSLCQAIAGTGAGAGTGPKDGRPGKGETDPAAAGPPPPQEVLLRAKEWHALAGGPQRIREKLVEAPPRPREGWPKVLGETTAGPWVSSGEARVLSSRSAPRWPAVRLLFKETQVYNATARAGVEAWGYLATSRSLRMCPLWLAPPDAPFSLPGLERFATHWEALRHPQDPTGKAPAYPAIALEQLDGSERLLATPVWVTDGVSDEGDDTQWS